MFEDAKIVLFLSLRAFGSCVVRAPGKMLHARVALTALHFPNTIFNCSDHGSLLLLDLVRWCGRF